ncbi:unnamed protein product [Leuciscus chuanchicus]
MKRQSCVSVRVCSDGPDTHFGGPGHCLHRWLQSSTDYAFVRCEKGSRWLRDGEHMEEKSKQALAEFGSGLSSPHREASPAHRIKEQAVTAFVNEVSFDSL